MITMIRALPVGNALRIFLSPPSGSTKWRLLRRLDDNFVDENDPGAVVIHDGKSSVILDSTSTLINGTTYYYRAYYFDGIIWTASTSATGAPLSTIGDVSEDPLVVVRDRLKQGLAAEVAASRLQPASGKIPVLTAPPQFEETRFPVVTVHLESDAPAERALAEEIIAGVGDMSGWEDYEGWFSRVDLSITAWSLNPDERIALRQALKRIILGNLPVFDEHGMLQVNFSQNDTEDFTSFNAPVYQVIGKFDCLAPSLVSGQESAIADVEVTVNGDVTHV